MCSTRWGTELAHSFGIFLCRMYGRKNLHNWQKQQDRECCAMLREDAYRAGEVFILSKIPQSISESLGNHPLSPIQLRGSVLEYIVDPISIIRYGRSLNER